MYTKLVTHIQNWLATMSNLAENPFPVNWSCGFHKAGIGSEGRSE